MSWEPERNYIAKIGGIIYKNVESPIVYDGCPMIRITRSSETSELGISFKVFNEKGEQIGNVENNNITFTDTDSYIIVDGFKRQALVDKKNGRVLCDLKFAIHPSDPEIEVSTILFSKDGFPILLHPDRSKFGKANDNAPPNLSAFTLTTNENSESGGIAMKMGGTLYLLGIAIENFKKGISVNK